MEAGFLSTQICYQNAKESLLFVGVGKIPDNLNHLNKRGKGAEILILALKLKQ